LIARTTLGGGAIGERVGVVLPSEHLQVLVD
jgi:hypothetical protein